MPSRAKLRRRSSSVLFVQPREEENEGILHSGLLLPYKVKRRGGSFYLLSGDQ